MARLILENLSMEQAKVFADYFEGQGEQDCIIWFDENKIESPITDVHKSIIVNQEAQEVILFCK